mgnify:FL=1
MKTFQKITLAAAISAAPFASQALEALDDSVLAATTGQAGVTIEMNIGSGGISIDTIQYTDTNAAAIDAVAEVTNADGVVTTAGVTAVAAQTTDGGSVNLENFKISQAQITQTIDVRNDGSLIMGMKTDQDLVVSLGNAGGAKNSASAVALVSAAGDKTEFVNDLSLTVSLGDTTTTILNLADATTKADLAATHLAASQGSLAIVADAAVEISAMNVGVFGYTEDQATAKASEAAGAYATAWTNATTPAAKLALASQYGDLDNSGVLDSAEQTTMANDIADGSAIQIGGLAFYGETAPGSNTYAAGNKVNVKQTIWADSTGVSIAMGDIKGALKIDSIAIGGNSIGSVLVSGLNLSGMTQKIYGHR